ncbi:MAG: hypothetical protein WA061_02205 [Microgenomates group bacterium]
MQKKLYDDCKAKEDGSLDITWSELASRYNIFSGKILSDRWYRIKSKPNPELEDVEDISSNPVKQSLENFFESQPDVIDDDLDDDTPEYKETIEMKSDGSMYSDRLIEICEQDLKSPRSILIAHKFDPELWEVVNCKNNLWHSPRVKDLGLRVLYQSKLTTKPRIPEWTEERLLSMFDSLAAKDFSPVEILPSSYSINGKSLVIPIADLHIGLLATMQANNNEYNMEIMEKLYRSTISQIKERVSGQKFEEVVFVVGNDFLNTDNLANTTSHGTPQDSATFWYSIVDKAIELISVGINSFLEIAPVYVYNIVSNHDGQSMYGVMKVIEQMYKNNRYVHIDVSPLPRKYHQFGRTLLALTHDMKIAKGLETMTVEAKDKWSECNKFYWILAHLHTEMQYQKSGLMEIYRVPTISGYSRWSNDKAFVQTEKKTQCFVVDEESGIVDTMYIIV